MPITRRALGLAVLSSAAGFSAVARAQQGPAIPPLPLSIAVVSLEEGPVVSEAWVTRQVKEAQRLFLPHGLSFVAARRRALPASVARLENARDRDALAAFLDDKMINVFVVAALRDVHDPRLFRMGVRWRKLSDLRKTYVIVAKSAWESTLCHELGHYFGNGHSPVVNNIMSYKRDDPDKVAFDEHQGRRMRRVARELLAAGKLLPADKLLQA